MKLNTLSEILKRVPIPRKTQYLMKMSQNAFVDVIDFIITSYVTVKLIVITYNTKSLKVLSFFLPYLLFLMIFLPYTSEPTLQMQHHGNFCLEFKHCYIENVYRSTHYAYPKSNMILQKFIFLKTFNAVIKPFSTKAIPL